MREWWVVRGSNPRPTRCKRVALPAELTTLFILKRKVLSHRGKENADPVIEPAFGSITYFSCSQHPLKERQL